MLKSVRDVTCSRLKVLPKAWRAIDSSSESKLLCIFVVTLCRRYLSCLWYGLAASTCSESSSRSTSGRQLPSFGSARSFDPSAIFGSAIVIEFFASLLLASNRFGCG